MAVLPEKEEDIDWNVDMEVQLFHAMRGHKPVGVNRYFQMALIHEKFSNSINKEISSKQIWSHLDTMYDMAALHDSEILPFPNDQVDFILPTSEFSDLISKKLDELPLSQAVTPKTNKNESSPSRTNNVPVAKTPKATPVKVNQSHSSQTQNKITKDLMGAKLSVPLTPISTKINKSEVTVKTETKLPRDPGVTSKNKSDGTPIVKVNKALTPVNLSTSKGVKLELPGGSQKNSKSDSSSDSSSKKGNKQDSSSHSKKHKSDKIENVSQKKIKNENEGNFKRLKSEGIAETPNNKKNSKPENSNGTKKQKGDSDGFKKQKGEGDWTKKHKSDGDGTKKLKGDGDGIKKSSDSPGTKSSKSESKTNLSTPSKGIKGEEDSSSSTVASAKTPKTLNKGEGSDSLNKRKRQKNDDSQKKTGTPGSTSATKRRRN